MPLIPYPDVPPLPGVPALNRAGNYVAAALTILGEILPLNFFPDQWLITGSSGATVIYPDSFIAFEYRQDRKVPTYPVEEGSFSSYNKVAIPFDIRLTVACSGNGVMSQESFLFAIEDLLASLQLVSVVTPDFTYDNCNLIHVDYRREARQGATLIVAQLWFQQILVAAQPNNQSAQPSGSPTVDNGNVTPITPSNVNTSTVSPQ